LVLAIASLVREHVLGQNAFDPNDATSTLAKTEQLAALSIAALDAANAALDAGKELDELPLADVRRAIAELRRAPAATYLARHVEADALIGGLR